MMRIPMNSVAMAHRIIDRLLYGVHRRDFYHVIEESSRRNAVVVRGREGSFDLDTRVIPWNLLKRR